MGTVFDIPFQPVVSTVPPPMRKTAGHDRGGVNFPGVATWTPKKTLEEMDKHGVQTAIL